MKLNRVNLIVIGVFLALHSLIGLQMGIMAGVFEKEYSKSDCANTPNSWLAATNAGWLLGCWLTKPWEEKKR